MPYLIAYDLGTGGIKASLHRDDGALAARAFSEYPTYYPSPGRHEQRPEDWWRGVCGATAELLRQTGIHARDVRAVALSGHSLVAAPIDREGRLLMDSLPIWSDTRAETEARQFFARVPYREWYRTTGNGDPPETYSVMKLMWLKNHHPGIVDQTYKFIGSKDYINFKLTGVVATDYSYASGSGMFDLNAWRYRDEYIAAAGVDRPMLPDIVDSHAIVGTVTNQAAAECGLAPGTLVACGGVDNSCMALGARGVGEGRAYLSLGSSSWIAVTSKVPVIDDNTRPFIFAHVERGYSTSGVSIFAAGSAWRWARDELCRDMTGENRYEAMNALAASVPPGARGVRFNPSLSGGSTQNVSTNLSGAFTGITLGTAREDMLRAVLEGVALDLGCYCLPVLRRKVALEDEMLICGGGAQSPLWMQIFADVFGMSIMKTNIDQDAASLGAAAVAARAAGLWDDYGRIDALHRVERVYEPDPEKWKIYEAIAGEYMRWTEGLGKIIKGG